MSVDRCVHLWYHNRAEVSIPSPPSNRGPIGPGAHGLGFCAPRRVRSLLPARPPAALCEHARGSGQQTDPVLMRSHPRKFLVYPSLGVGTDGPAGAGLTHQAAPSAGEAVCSDKAPLAGAAGPRLMGVTPKDSTPSPSGVSLGFSLHFPLADARLHAFTRHH